MGSPVFATTRAWEVEEDSFDVASDDPSFGVRGLGEDEEQGWVEDEMAEEKR